jgi:hypothetical protein
MSEPMQEAVPAFVGSDLAPQGGVISPLLANIYLHYVLDEWFETVARPCLKGRCILVPGTGARF